ncbi:MAG: hypothetical protein LWW85_15555, partial [Marinilabiliales bacterium]|nr:hypothetical protein [Marinilabiliales bacterium]
GVELSRSNQKRGHPELLQVSMLHTCNSSPQTGRFNCSNQLFNRIDQLIDWAIRSNLQSVVTDCPHREKLGWLEQTYLMGSALLYNYDLYALYNKMADDMRDAQTIDGLVPDIAPEYTHFLGGFRDSPEWGSAAVIVPWMLWQWYGDQRIVQKSLPMMQRYVDYLTSKSNHYILSHGLGDWFDYGPKSPGEAQLTPKSLTATALYCYDAQLLSHMLTLQGMDIQAQHYSQLADSIRQAFNDRFYDGAAKRYATGSQTAMAMPLCCGLVPEKDRSAVREQLVSSVIASDYALTAGDIGFHFLVKALADAGAAETLFRMNARDDKPGYGYQLKKGATALTESWPALEEVSNNHLMLGHLMEWFYSGIGGIAQEEGSTAFRHLLIRPSLTGDLKGADCSFQSPNGWVRNHWTFDGTQMKQTVEIPCNTDACLIFPGKMGRILDEKGKVLAVNHSRDGFLMIKTGSGKYIFTFLPE